MKLVSFSIERPVTIAMIFLASVVFGWVSCSRLDVKLLPEISYPTLTVQTPYPDAAPLEVENFVTRPLEEAVGVIAGLRNVRSISKTGMSTIILEFSWDTAMDYAALDVREKIDLVLLPRETAPPMILRYDPALDPVIRLGLYGDDNLVRLRYIADRIVKKELESLDGIASAKVLGGLEEEIQVELDERKLASYNIPITAVSARLSEDNINQSGGRLRDRGSVFLLRTENEFRDIDDIRNTIVQEEDGRKVVLADLGEITRGYMERKIITRINGKEAVEVAIHKEGDANTVEVAERLKWRANLLQDELPEGVKLDVLFDQSRFIETSINEVRNNAVLGALLAVTILYLFLRDFRSTLIIGLSIPVSILSTFVLMRQLGVSLNLMSLGGLALGVGMLVDNSIVVLENISRHKDKGQDRKAATYTGASEVGRAVIASTLTSVAVFLPIIFVEGIAGQVFRDQALTVSASLVASLVVALMLIPMVSSLSGREQATTEALFGPKEEKKKRWFGRFVTGPIGKSFTFVSSWLLRIIVLIVRLISWIGSMVFGLVAKGFNWLYGKVEKLYTPALDFALQRRALFLTMIVGLFAVSILAGSRLGGELIPQFAQGEFSFTVEMPEGSPIEATDAKLREMEEAAQGIDGVASFFTSVGQAGRLGSNAKTEDEAIGELNVILADKSDRYAEERIVQEMRRRFENIDGVTTKFARPTYFTMQTPVQVELYGYNLRELKNVADHFEREIAGVGGVKDVKSSMEVGNPEVNVVFDRDRLSSLGLSLDEVSNWLKTKIQGEVPTKFKERELQVDIRVRTSAWRAENVDELRGLVVGVHEDRPIQLGTVASVDVARGLTQIMRLSQQRAAIVSGNLDGRDLAGVSTDIQGIIDETPLPLGVTAELGGQNEEFNRSYRSLMFALLLAIFLVYLVMAAQFESFIHPFIILFTVPLGAIGVIWLLLMTGQSVSVVVFIGVIMLAGIVVNNGIVLIDYINTLRRDGMSKFDALREAGRVRLRPIVMTTLTTVLGLLPMALGIGEGAEIRAPMALTVIGGLLGATVLTLLVIPSTYSIIDRGK